MHHEGIELILPRRSFLLSSGREGLDRRQWGVVGEAASPGAGSGINWRISWWGYWAGSVQGFLSTVAGFFSSGLGMGGGSGSAVEGCNRGCVGNIGVLSGLSLSGRWAWLLDDCADKPGSARPR